MIIALEHTRFAGFKEDAQGDPAMLDLLKTVEAYMETVATAAGSGTTVEAFTAMQGLDEAASALMFAIEQLRVDLAVKIKLAQAEIPGTVH
jgi:hypothetical protein